MLKNLNYIITIILYPFILILSYFLLTNYIKGDLYSFLLFSMIIVFIPSFIMSLYGVLDDILNSKSKWKIILVILFSIFYIPYYYTRHIAKQEVYLGIVISMLCILFSIVTYNVSLKKLREYFDSLYLNSVIINENYSYTSSNNLIRMSVDKSFRCSSNIGDYIISCDRLEDDSFIGIYSYDITDYSEGDIKDIIDFHINQTIDYINENNYTYGIDNENQIIRIFYNDMVILITQNNYIVGDKKYSLIILKELPSNLLDLKEFEKMIESITFLNYNNGVSS